MDVRKRVVRKKINKEARKALKRAAKLIEEGGLHKGYFSVDAEGRFTSPSSDDSVKWCAVGALHKACNDMHPDLISNVFGVAMTALQHVVARDVGKFRSVSVWNDAPSTTPKDVVRGLKEARRKLKNA